MAHSFPAGTKVRGSSGHGALISAGEEDVTSDYVFSIFRVDLLNFIFHQMAGLPVKQGWENEFESGARAQLRKRHELWNGGSRAKPSFIPPANPAYDYALLSDRESMEGDGDFGFASVHIRQEEKLVVSDDELEDLLKDAAESGDVIMAEAEHAGEAAGPPRRARRAAASSALQMMRDEANNADAAGKSAQDQGAVNGEQGQGQGQAEEDESDGGEFNVNANPSPPEVSERGSEHGDGAGTQGDGGNSFVPPPEDEEEDDEDLLRELEEEDLAGGVEDVELPPDSEYARRLREIQEQERAEAATGSGGEESGRGRRRRTAAAQPGGISADASRPAAFVAPPATTTNQQDLDTVVLPVSPPLPDLGAGGGHGIAPSALRLEPPTSGLELDEFTMLGDVQGMQGGSANEWTDL